MEEFKLPQKLIRLIGISITETFVKIKVGSAETEPILIKSGLRQGDSISPILFNLILEKVVREMDIQPQEGVKLQESNITILAYADDVVLMSKSQDNLRSLFTHLEEKAKRVGLQVNEEKTELFGIYELYMVVGRGDSVAVFPYLKVGRYEFSRVKQFKYLGSILTKKMRLTKK